MTTMDTVNVLATLRDVPGVQGSFLIGPQGALAARDLAPMFADEVLKEVGPRLVRLGDAFADGGAKVLGSVLNCGSYLLYLRAVERGTLCVLASDGVSMPALRMGTNLAARRLAALPPAAPPPVPPPLPAPVAKVAEAAPSRPSVQWRGVVVRDRG
jgi:hypothetical protein